MHQFVAIVIQIQQLHQMEEKAERDFSSFVERTSNHKALKVFYSTPANLTFVTRTDMFQEAKKYQLNVLNASRRSSVAIG